MIKKFASKLFTKIEGMLLVESIVHMAVVTMTTCFMLQMLFSFQTFYKNLQTMKRIEYATEVLKQYAKVYGSLPYPAESLNGLEMAPYANTADVKLNPLQKSVGYLPYIALGIDPQFAYDGHGNPLQYYVSIVMCSTADRISTPNLKRALLCNGNSLLLSHVEPGEMEYDIKKLGPASYLRIRLPSGTVGIINEEKVILLSEILFNDEKNQQQRVELSKYNIINVPAFAIKAGGKAVTRPTNIVDTTDAKQYRWVNRLEVAAS